MYTFIYTLKHINNQSSHYHIQYLSLAFNIIFASSISKPSVQISNYKFTKYTEYDLDVFATLFNAESIPIEFE